MKVDPRSYERNYTQLRKEAWKKFRTWTCDLAIPVRRPNQLSYKATDVGSRSIVGSYVTVKVKNESDVCKWCYSSLLPLPVRKKCGLCVFNIVGGVGGGVGHVKMNLARLFVSHVYKEPQVHICPKTFVHDCS